MDIIYTQLFDNRISHVGLLTHFTHTHTHTLTTETYTDLKLSLNEAFQTLHRRDAGLTKDVREVGTRLVVWLYRNRGVCVWGKGRY